MNLDKEILEFGRLQTAVWIKKNSSLYKEKLTNLKTDKLKNLK